MQKHKKKQRTSFVLNDSHLSFANFNSINMNKNKHIFCFYMDEFDKKRNALMSNHHIDLVYKERMQEHKKKYQ